MSSPVDEFSGMEGIPETLLWVSLFFFGGDKTSSIHLFHGMSSLLSPWEVGKCSCWTSGSF